MTARRLLIVSPGFHGYHAAIARAFESLGYQTQTYCYDVARSGAEKLWNKARHELPAKVRGGASHQSAQTVSRRAERRVRESSADLVLVIRGDTFDEQFWRAASHGGRPVGVWMYDEMRRTTFDASLVSEHARIATYSADDTHDLLARDIDALHVPLGFDSTADDRRTEAPLGLVSFLGAPSDKREQALLALQSAGVPVRAWGRGWSDHPIDRARTWRLNSSGLPNGRDVPSATAHAIMRASVGTLNIHGDQDGFTMRTFEAAGCGAVQFIDRADVAALYDPGREVLVYESHEELIEQARHVLARPHDFLQLRAAARERTAAEHTLTHRARVLEQLWA